MVVAAIVDVDQVQTKYTSRHREGTRKQVQGILRTRGPRKHHTLSQARGICQHKQAGKHTNEGKERANRKDMQCKHPGQATCDPLEWWMMARTSAVWASSRGSWPKTWSCSRICQAHNRFPRPWLQNVSARAIFDRLRLSEMIKEGPHGRTRTSSGVSFDNAKLPGDTVPSMYRQAVPAPWATFGDFPSFFASSSFLAPCFSFVCMRQQLASEG